MTKKNVRFIICSIILFMVLILCVLGQQTAKAAEEQMEQAAKDQPVQAVKEQPAAAAESKATTTATVENWVIVGLTSPELGPYGKQGTDQRRAAEMATEEINAAGGILGKKVKIIYRDTKSNPRIAKEIGLELFDKENVQMIFGGVSSAVSLTVGKLAKSREKIYFAASSYSTDLTSEEGHRYLFRESYDSRMAAMALSDYLKKNFAGKKYFYVTTDDNWGWTTEEVFRQVTGTTDKDEHRGFQSKLWADDYKSILKMAQEKAQVLVLILFGRDLEIAVTQSYEMGLQKNMQIVVPSMTIDMADGAGPEVMEGILSTTPWFWKLPFDEKYAKGIEFVENYEKKYQRYPTSTGASAYVILYQYKEAVERAKSFETDEVIKALEDHKYIGLKDEQQWRKMDHQSIQTVYAVRLKKAEDVKKDKYKMDYYEVIKKIKPQDGALTAEEWSAAREAVNTSPALE